MKFSKSMRMADEPINAGSGLSPDFAQKEDLALLADDTEIDNKPPVDKKPPAGSDEKIEKEVEEDEKALESDDEEKPEEKKEEEDDKALEDLDKLDDIEDDDKDTKKEEKEDKDVPEEVRPSFSKIRAKYPTFLKEFPEVAAAMGRDFNYSKLFSGVEEAKEIIKKVDDFTELESKILEGDPQMLLDNLHKTDPEALEAFVLNVIPAVQAGDIKLFYKMTMPYVNRVLRNALAEGERTNNKNVVLAVKHLSNFLHGTPDVPEDTKKDDKEGNKEAEKYKKELEAERGNRVKSFITGVNTASRGRLEKFIKNDIDPENALSETFRNYIVDSMLKEIGQAFTKDEAGKQELDRKWAKARKNNYTEEDKTELITAYLGRAKKVLPSIRAKYKQEVRDHIASKSKPKEEESDKTKKRTIPGGTGPITKSKIAEMSAEQLDKKKISDEQFLSS